MSHSFEMQFFILVDFGSYGQDNYSVQTPEGERISQILSGYIDILMAQRRPADHLGISGEEEVTLEEEIVEPSK